MQGDLFSEAPKPFVSEETKVMNESTKSKKAPTAGKTALQITRVQAYRKKWTSRLSPNFSLLSKNLLNLERRFQ